MLGSGEARQRWWVVGLLLAGVAFAEDAAQRRAREELERELERLTGGTQPSRVRLDFVAPDEPNYRLEEASFEIDDAPVKAPALAALQGDEPVVIFSGEVPPGKHKVGVRLRYTNATSAV
ncbi:MAG: hypothetical protein JNG84_15030, partial [Archangium sp.]|nr:hypothetical protein [Archangium sp.]